MIGVMSARLRYAREQLEALDEPCHRQILQAGVALVDAQSERVAAARSSWVNIYSDFPDALKFIEPQFIRLIKRTCIIYLHEGQVLALAMKSPGMTIGAGNWRRSMNT